MLRGALAVADGGGLEALTIRSLAQELGVKPMSVYYHVANKSEIIDGIVALVFSESSPRSTSSSTATTSGPSSTSASP
ncbi:MAG TPA: TetR family transcriptional regulator [Actinoplanes sp.]